MLTVAEQTFHVSLDALSGDDRFASASDYRSVAHDRIVLRNVHAVLQNTASHSDISVSDVLEQCFCNEELRHADNICDSWSLLDNPHNHHPNTDDNLPVLIGSQNLHTCNLNARPVHYGIRSCSKSVQCSSRHIAYAHAVYAKRPYNFNLAENFRAIATRTQAASQRSSVRASRSPFQQSSGNLP